MVFVVTSSILGDPTVKHPEWQRLYVNLAEQRICRIQAPEAIMSRTYYQNDEYILT